MAFDLLSVLALLAFVALVCALGLRAASALAAERRRSPGSVSDDRPAGRDGAEEPDPSKRVG